MNGRIQELVEQSGISLYKKDVLDKHFPELYDSVYCESSVEELEKFAKLIINECGDVAYRAFWDNPDTVRGIHIKQKIKEHFGVEE